MTPPATGLGDRTTGPYYILANQDHWVPPGPGRLVDRTIRVRQGRLGVKPWVFTLRVQPYSDQPLEEFGAELCERLSMELPPPPLPEDTAAWITGCVYARTAANAASTALLPVIKRAGDLIVQRMAIAVERAI